MTGADYDYQGDESYQYDDNGNRVNNGYAVGTNNEMTSDGTYRYLYDAEGNRTRKFRDQNANGQLDSGDTDITEYAWDHRNRQAKKVSEADGARGQPAQITYYWPGCTRMVLRIPPQATAQRRGRRTSLAQPGHYVFDGGRIALELSGSHATRLWGVGMDQPQGHWPRCPVTRTALAAFLDCSTRRATLSARMPAA